MNALEQSIKQLGGQTALANALNEFLNKREQVKQAHIWNWLNRDSKVPADKVILMEKVTGIPRYEFRPDIYPKKDYQQAS